MSSSRINHPGNGAFILGQPRAFKTILYGGLAAGVGDGGLLRRPIITGLIYGMIAYLGLNDIVVSLSAARHGTFHLGSFVIEIIGMHFWLGYPLH